jgi:hypothetical protein
MMRFMCGPKVILAVHQFLCAIHCLRCSKNYREIYFLPNTKRISKKCWKQTMQWIKLRRLERKVLKKSPIIILEMHFSRPNMKSRYLIESIIICVKSQVAWKMKFFYKILINVRNFNLHCINDKLKTELFEKRKTQSKNFFHLFLSDWFAIQSVICIISIIHLTNPIFFVEFFRYQNLQKKKIYGKNSLFDSTFIQHWQHKSNFRPSYVL